MTRCSSSFLRPSDSLIVKITVIKQTNKACLKGGTCLLHRIINCEMEAASSGLGWRQSAVSREKRDLPLDTVPLHRFGMGVSQRLQLVGKSEEANHY